VGSSPSTHPELELVELLEVELAVDSPVVVVVEATVVVWVPGDVISTSAQFDQI
jgi:hypothetical protein